MFHLKPENAEALLKQQGYSNIDALKAMVLNIRYNGTKAIITTGTAYHTFVMNKEADIIWDKALTKYLSDKGIEYEIL